MIRTTSRASVIAMAITCALFVGLSAPPASAGIVIEFQHTPAGSSAPQNSTVYIEADRLRMETPENVAIWRADKEEFAILDPAKKSYMMMDKEQMEAVGAQMSEAMKMMEAQMKNMPPEARAQMERMMKGRGMDTASNTAKRVIRKTGETDRVADRPCTGYAVSIDGVVDQKMCVASWSAMDISMSDLAAFESLSKFIRSGSGLMAKRFSFGFVQDYSEEESQDSIPGVPLRTVTTTDRGESIDEFVSMNRTEISGDKFEVPSGWKRQQLGELGGPPGMKGRRPGGY